MNHFYVSASAAHNALEERKEFRHQVEEWWKKEKYDVPIIMLRHRIGILARQVATCRFEDMIFKDMSQKNGFVPWWFEYTADKFVSNSSFKMSLIKTYSFEGIGKKGGEKTKKRVIADAAQCQGKPINTLTTFAGQKLVDFHHHWRQNVWPDVGKNFLDMSARLKKIGGARQYYKFFLSLFIAHAALFEDYHGGESGDNLNVFTANIFEPAYYELERIFGVKPIIVKMPWEEYYKYFLPSGE